MNVILIVNANSFDFDIETFTTEPSNSDAIGSHADGRMVKYLKNLYIWHDATGNWIKFSNSSDYSLLESDLSTQITNRQSTVSSLESTDSSLEEVLSIEESTLTSSIASLQDTRSQELASLQSERSIEHANLSEELSTQISARVSLVDSAQARAQFSESTISTALSTAIVDRESDLSSETSRAQSAEADISANLLTAISEREDDISAEKSRAESVELLISTAISLSSTNLQTEIASVENSLSGQEGESSNEYSTLSSILAQDAVLRSQAHDTIQDSVDAVSIQLSAMLFAAEADISTMSQIASYINTVDLSHDIQTSQEFSNLQSAIDSASLARSQEDSTIQSALESAITVRLQEDSVLQSSINSATTSRSQQESNIQSAIASAETRRSQQDSILDSSIASHITARTEEYSVLTSNISAEKEERDSEHTNLSQAISLEASAEASGEESLQSSIASLISSLESVDVALSNELSTQISNQGSANTNLDSTFAADLEAAALARSQEDSIIQSTLASTQLSRSQEDSAIQSVLDLEELQQSSLLSSLTERVSIQESDNSSSTSALASSLLSAEIARSQEDSTLATAISTESSRITSMLADASIHNGEALDTFVELVSFLTEVDTESDDALADYISTIESNIALENSLLIDMRDEQSQELSTQISARISSVESMESRASLAEYSLDLALSAVESYEDARHLKINFTNATSLTVGTADLAGIGFNPGNGMVQVFREDSSGSLHHLVAPSTFNPTSGEMTFDLGSIAKTGFAIFYSFGPSTTSTTSSTTSNSSSSSYPDFVITGATMSQGALQGDSSSVTFNITGVTAANLDSFLQYSADTFYLAVGGQMTFSYYDVQQSRNGVSFDWATDYSSFTIAWENVNNASSSSDTAAPSGDVYTASLFFGSHTDRAYFRAHFRFDSVSGALVPSYSSAGEYINNGNTLYLSPPYMVGSGTATYTTNVQQGTYNVRNNVTRTLRGPQWSIPLGNLTSHLVSNQSTSNNVKNYVSQTGIFTTQNGKIRYETQNIFFDTFDGAWGITITSGGIDRYSVGSNLNSSHHLYSEVTTNRTSTSAIDRMSASVDVTNEVLNFSYSDGSGYSTNNPDADSIVTLYLAASGTYGMHLINDTHITNSTTYNWGANTSYATDIKIVIDTAYQSYEIYRNSNVGGSPTWVAVDRAYLSNQEV